MSLIQVDNDGLITTRLHWDEHTGEAHVERTQDVEPVLERAKALRASGWDGYNADRSMQATHELPIAILEQWMSEGVNPMDPTHDAECRRRLADPALAGFRLTTASANTGLVIVKR